jgi:Calx-beta domain
VPASIQFLQSTQQVSAGAGSVDVEVARGMNASQQVSVNYSTTDSSARAGTDYVSTRGVLTFAPGQFYQQIAIPLLPGAAQDPGATFSINLSSPSGATLGSIETAQVTIEGNQTVYILPPPELVAPRGLGVVEVQHVKKKVTAVTIAFNEAMNPGSAGNSALYSVLGGVRRGKRMVYSKKVKLGTVSYDEGADTVSISLAKPYKGQVRVSVDGILEALDGVAGSSAFSDVVR